MLQQTPAALSAPVLLDEVPFFAQDAYQCGPAALATVLGASHIAVTPDDLVPLVYVPERQGSFQVELIAAARSYDRLAYEIPRTLNALLTEISAGNPVLVMQNLGVSWYPKWHYAVVKGFNVENRKLILNSGLQENYEISLSIFERTWARAEHWAIVVLEPGTMPASAEPLQYFNAVVALEAGTDAGVVANAYESGLQTWPTDRNLLMGYGNLSYGIGEAQIAADNFKKVTDTYPDYAPAYNNLAQILFESGDKAQARQYAEKAVALGGDFRELYQETLRTIVDDAERN
ncbi:MAG: PA2778 family cysteine peptidase [Pseudomonadota bacterium]